MNLSQAVALIKNFALGLRTQGIGVAAKYIDISLHCEKYTTFGTGQISFRLTYGCKLYFFHFLLILILK